ncbi:TetR family transcriptional regulator [Amycolatopsis sp. 195334CR]|uniref:TetR family transcriptional regulator n=1 Tax=Amycolatopsis sp. 195334CR TaxID=2814588 RepID=UPI001A8E25AC|nr:TetR family transcriptional regulator [Amycolatopsis sp. 195334CR]MBN6035977.1 TetR family transcriptional regulator [Amycolatopsis sp. 195334CR]
MENELELGMRERKKLRTRKALIGGALRLFHDKGFDETTVAEIAATADISTRTFFSYFESKDDIVFYDYRARLARSLELLNQRRPGEGAGQLLRRVLEQSVFQLADETDFDRARLIDSVPALRARELHLLFDTQRRLAHALHRACPAELDLVEAAAMVGALVGAIKMAIAASRGRGDDPQATQEAMRRAGDLALAGLDSRNRSTVD